MSAAVNRKILVFRVMSLCFNLASGCTTIEPISMDAPQGATPPGYVSAAFRESESPSTGYYFPLWVPAPIAEEGDEEEAVAGLVVDTGSNVLKALFRPAPKHEEFRPATKVNFMKPAPVAHAAPRAYVHERKQNSVRHAQYSPPKPAQHKTIHAPSVHKPSAPTPSSAGKKKK